MIIKIFIFCLIFWLMFVFLAYERKTIIKRIKPKPQDPAIDLGKYYSVTWDLRTGEVKEEKAE